MAANSSNKNILVFQHSSDCPVGSTGEFFKKHSLKFQIHYWPDRNSLPELLQYSGLLVLGGPQNVDEVEKFPWLTKERELISQFLELNRPMMGICLGAQLFAEVLGAKVKKLPFAEAGWGKVKLRPENSSLIPQITKELSVFHWHEYSFEIPKNASRIAENEITLNQGFVYRDNVIGFQFHPEADLEFVEKSVVDKTYPTGKFVQPASQLLDDPRQIESMRLWYHQILKNLFL